jgi:hypothetical protein
MLELKNIKVLSKSKILKMILDKRKELFKIKNKISRYDGNFAKNEITLHPEIKFNLDASFLKLSDEIELLEETLRLDRIDFRIKKEFYNKVLNQTEDNISDREAILSRHGE